MDMEFIVGLFILVYLLTVLCSAIAGLIGTLIITFKYGSIQRAPQQLKELDAICYSKSLIPFLNVCYSISFLMESSKKY